MVGGQCSTIVMQEQITQIDALLPGYPCIRSPLFTVAEGGKMLPLFHRKISVVNEAVFIPNSSDLRYGNFTVLVQTWPRPRHRS